MNQPESSSSTNAKLDLKLFTPPPTPTSNDTQALPSDAYETEQVSPDLLPPINIHTLKEIEIREIFRNVQLRHDIIFDEYLQFKPNLDDRKRRRISHYWTKIRNELEAGQYNLIFYLFLTIKDILKSLLPNKEYVDGILDTEIVVRQIGNGGFEYKEFARWINGVVKMHCAPIRDSLADELLDDSADVVDGLRKVVELLELMKLDIANHQIRTLRAVLVDSATEFEKSYYRNLIANGSIDISTSLNWYARHYGNHQTTDFKAVFNLAVIDLLKCSCSEFPVLFNFDYQRICAFKLKIRKLTCLNLIIEYYKMAKSSRKKSAAEIIKNNVVSIVCDANGNFKWTKNLNQISLELVKHLSSVEDTDLLEVTNNWLKNNLNPSSPVYVLFEEKLLKGVMAKLNSGVTVGSNLPAPAKKDEVESLIFELNLLINFHWSVFNFYYVNYINNQQ